MIVQESEKGIFVNELYVAIAMTVLLVLAVRKFLRNHPRETWERKHYRSILLLVTTLLSAVVFTIALLIGGVQEVALVRSGFGCAFIIVSMVPCQLSIVRNNPILYVPRNALFLLAGGSCILRSLTEMNVQWALTIAS